MNPRFKDYPSLLNEIRSRPQLWHGGEERSVELLAAFLSGIRIGEELHEIPPSNRLRGFDWEAFESWVETNFNAKKLTFNSFSLAAHFSRSQKEAFDLWYSWHDEFTKEIQNGLP